MRQRDFAMTSRANHQTTKAAPSSETTRLRLKLLRHAVASASLEGAQIDEVTKGWLGDFANGRLTEEEVIARIKADV